VFKGAYTSHRLTWHMIAYISPGTNLPSRPNKNTQPRHVIQPKTTMLLMCGC